MKITKLSIKGHPVLGDFLLDFTNSSGKACKNIVFAGGNGSGKTTILEILSEMRWLFSSGKTIGRNELAQKFPYEVSLEFETGDAVISRPENTRREIEGGKDSYIKQYSDTLYSTVGIDYDFQKTTGIPNRVLDSKNSNKDREKGNRSNSRIAAELNGLFTSINSKDAQEVLAWADEHPDEPVQESEKHRRMRRFTTAFSKIFSTTEFKKVSENQRVIFSKNGTEVELSNLSSGEKQVVFRGGYLLKDINIYQSPFVMIDEPEISLHPKWQEKIFDFYTSLFDNLDAQVFIATHSEYVVESAIKSPDSLVIVLSDNEAKKIDQSPVLSHITSAEVNYLAFGTRALEYHNQLYSELEIISGFERSNKDFDQWLLGKGIPLDKKRCTTDGRNVPCTLCSYIRNEYHHPNPGKNPYSDQDVEKSISEIIGIVRGGREKWYD